MGSASSSIVSPPIPSQSQEAVTPSLTLSSSFPIVVHHPPLHPCDSAHLVSLASTYNSPLSLHNPRFQETHMDSDKKFPQFFFRSFTYHHNSSNPASAKPLWRHSQTTPSNWRRRQWARRRPLYDVSERDQADPRGLLRRPQHTAGFMVAVDERNMSMDATQRRELQTLLGKARPFSLSQLFMGGRLVDGAEEVRQLHSGGELGRVLEGASRMDPTFVCCGCGGVRFMPCGDCNGSRKIFVEEERRMRRCGECNENGLVLCLNCSSSSF